MATDIARRNQPGVIELDINMPAGRGDSAHDRISKIPETAAIPAIYLTGDPSRSVETRSSELGAVAIVRTPLMSRNFSHPSSRRRVEKYPAPPLPKPREAPISNWMRRRACCGLLAMRWMEARRPVLCGPH